MERYVRQIALPRLGQQGQQKLGESKVLIVGLGGLGSPAALYLAAAGVGTIGLVDGDEVAVHNLNRQLLFNTEDVGKRKADVALKHLQALNPQLNYRKYDIIISSTNGAKIIRNYDLVLSCVDRFESRYLLNELCVAANVPMIDGAIQNLNGYVFPIIPGETACYHCLHEGMQDQAGVKPVLGAFAGVVGALMAAEAVKMICGLNPLSGQMLMCDFWDMEFQKITVARNPLCTICSK